jgi:VWFA-related protein
MLPTGRLLAMRRHAVCRAIVTAPCFLLAALYGQDSGVLLRSNTRVVEIDVSVRDSAGNPVNDLQQRDFTILDNGRPHPFTIFSFNGSEATPQAAEPAVSPTAPSLPPGIFTNAGKSSLSSNRDHATVLLLDGVNGWFESFARASKAVAGLMDRLPPDEWIAVYVVSKFQGLLLLADYTKDRERVRKALADFTPTGLEPACRPGPGPDGGGMRPESGPTEKDAWIFKLGKCGKPPMLPHERDFFMREGAERARLSLTALAEKLRTLPGQKTLYWVTEGFPPRMMRNDAGWDKTVSALNDANVAVNTVDNDGLGGPERLWGNGAILTMQQLAERTGGRAFFHRNDLDAAIAEGVRASRANYTIGFYLGELDGKYHELRVRVERPGLELNYRRGYYAQTDAMRDLTARKTELESVLLSPIDLTGVRIEAAVENKGENLIIHLKLSAESLTLTQHAGAWNGRVEELFVEQNDTGELARVKQNTRLEFGVAGKADVDQRGVILTQALRYVSGAKKLLIVIRDSSSGRTGSLSVPLTPM